MAFKELKPSPPTSQVGSTAALVMVLCIFTFPHVSVVGTTYLAWVLAYFRLPSIPPSQVQINGNRPAALDVEVRV